MTATDRKTFAIFTTDNGRTDRLEHATKAGNADEAFEAFASDFFSGDRSVEAGWDWHVYEIPSEIAYDDDAIREYVEGRTPITITS